MACYRHPGRPTRLSCSSCGRPTCVDCTVPAAVGQKCPECAAPTGRSRVITSREVQSRSSLSGAPVVATLMGVSIVLAALSYIAFPLWVDLYNVLNHDVARVAQGEWWRLLTSAVLHEPQSIFHIAFNMWALLLFGPAIEKRAGSVPFALLYLASAAGGGLLFQLARDGGVAVGASGAIFGLFGLHVAAAFLARDTVAGRASLRQLVPLLAINLALPIFVPRIAWEAHVGGFLVGALIMFAWARVAPLSAVRRDSGTSPVVARSVVAGAVLVGCLVAVLVV